MMRRREFITLLGGAAMAWPVALVCARHARRPVDGNRADDRLAAVVHMNMLNPHELRAAIT